MGASGNEGATKASSLLAPEYLHGIYIPSALLLIGTTIVKREWLPFAALFAAAAGAWKVYGKSEYAVIKYFQKKEEKDSVEEFCLISLHQECAKCSIRRYFKNLS